MNVHTRVIVLFFLSLFCLSCEKEDQTIGIGMLPDSDLLTTAADSSTIITLETIADDSTRSTLVTYMLGENYDDVFGKTRASYATRLYLQSMVTDFEGYKLDSACFNLAKSAKYVYGDTTVAQTFSVYEMPQAITVADCKNYEENGTKPAWLSSIKSATKICDLQVSAYKDTLKTFSCKLTTEYATELFSKIKESTRTDTSLQYVDSLFIQKFNGIYVTTKDNQFNDIHSVIVHSLPGITLYLSSKDTTTTITLAPSPQPYNEALKSDPSQIYLQAINIFEHEYPSAITSNTENTAYVQGFMGVKTKVTFSDLEKWRDAVDHNTASDSTLVINSAKLYLPIKKYDTWNQYLPLNFRVYDETIKPHKLVYSTVSTTEDSTNFIFNIHSFLITLYNGATKADNYSYEIAVPENNAYGNMFVLDGTTDPKKLKLVITYTK